MTNNVIRSILCCSLFLGACSSNKKDSVKSESLASTSASVSEIDRRDITLSQKSEALALLGEKLAFNIAGFVYANELFDLSLARDPSNQRSRFYKALLAPVMAQRGIWARIKPYMSRQPYEKQQEFQENISAFPTSVTKDFLLDGEPDLNSISDLQNYVDHLRTVMLESRTVLQSMKQNELKLEAILFNRGSVNDIIRDCAPIKKDNGVYIIKNCNWENHLSMSVARPDFEVLSLSFSSLAAGYLWMFSGYSLEGLEHLSQILETEHQKNGFIDYQKSLAIIKKQPDFLKLRNPKAFKELIALGEEGMEALVYSLKHQPSLCPKGELHETNRPGYLYPNGFCNDSNVSHNITNLNAILKGPFEIAKRIDPSISNFENDYDFNESKNGNVYTKRHNIENQNESSIYTTEINLQNFLENPPTDLKQLLPISWNQTTNEVQFADETLGGLFINGDASVFLNFGSTAQQFHVVPANEIK